MKKTIEIPFGAKDSELKGWEYTIPENMEAEIKDGKIIVKQKESEDERIRKQLIGFLSGRYALCNINTKDAIAYLERQKERGPLSKDEEYTLARIIEYLEDNDCPSEWKNLLHDVYSLLYQKEQEPMHFLEIPAGDIAPAEEESPFDEDEFLDGELSAFLQNYDKEYDDDAAVSDVARHFYEIGKKQKEQKPESCDCSRDEESYMNGIHHVLMNPEAYGLIKQKPAEWSEEDKLHLNNAILVAKKEWGVNSYTARFLESLRDNCKKCNSHWKPSDEQMEALKDAFRKDGGNEYRKVINSLYCDLQKLL